MSDRTGISWTDATWNPVRGCSRVSKGCARCYAEAFAARHVTRKGEPGPFAGYANTTRAGDPHWTGLVDLIPGQLDLPLRWKKPRRIFVNSMSDLFHEKLPDEAIDAIFAVMARCPQHTFQVLTKRPERMLQWFTATPGGATREQVVCSGTRELRWPGWPLPNVWLGVSVEDQEAADDRIPLLLHAPAMVHFISAEPLLGPVDIEDHFVSATADGFAGVDWVIIGGESGSGHRRMQVEWLEAIVQQCDAEIVPVFVKQDSGPLPGMQGRIRASLWARKHFPVQAP